MDNMNSLFTFSQGDPKLTAFGALDQFVQNICTPLQNGTPQMMMTQVPRTPAMGQFPMGAKPALGAHPAARLAAHCGQPGHGGDAGARHAPIAEPARNELERAECQHIAGRDEAATAVGCQGRRRHERRADIGADTGDQQRAGERAEQDQVADTKGAEEAKGERCIGPCALPENE